MSIRDSGHPSSITPPSTLSGVRHRRALLLPSASSPSATSTDVNQQGALRVTEPGAATTYLPRTRTDASYFLAAALAYSGFANARIDLGPIVIHGRTIFRHYRVGFSPRGTPSDSDRSIFTRRTKVQPSSSCTQPVHSLISADSTSVLRDNTDMFVEGLRQQIAARKCRSLCPQPRSLRDMVPRLTFGQY